jgi:hypothetical protein
MVFRGLGSQGKKWVCVSKDGKAVEKNNKKDRESR